MGLTSRVIPVSTGIQNLVSLRKVVFGSCRAPMPFPWIPAKNCGNDRVGQDCGNDRVG